MLRMFGLTLVGVIVAAMLLYWLLGRFSPRLAWPFGVLGTLAARLGVAVFCGIAGIKAVEHHSVPYFALATFLFLLALFSVVMGLLTLWGIVLRVRPTQPD